MPLAGKGMLVSRMDIAPEHDAEFNRWYDREHLAERVEIPGFVEARRYVAMQAESKYLALYTTETFDVLDGSAYRKVLANQTQWSLQNISRLQRPERGICRILASKGKGRGSVLGSARLRLASEDTEHELREWLDGLLDELLTIDGVLSVHLLQSDAELSKPLGAEHPPPGAGDWFVFIDATATTIVTQAEHRLRGSLKKDAAQLVAWETYQYLSDVSKQEFLQS